jgi:hypothetical protein
VRHVGKNYDPSSVARNLAASTLPPRVLPHYTWNLGIYEMRR